MKRILYILIAFIVTSCSFQQPKQSIIEPKPFNLPDTIFEDDSTIMIIRTNNSTIWEHAKK